jgi:D-aspartate ligase
MSRARERGAVAGPPAIVLGGSANAVSVARSLGAAGVRVHALGAAGSPARWSRYVHRFASWDGHDPQQRALDWLASGPRHGVVLPCEDEMLLLVVRRRAAITGMGYTTIEADDDVLAAMLDKQRTYELARELGIETPRTILVEGDAAPAEEVGFPCVLKPVHSHLLARHTPRVKVLRAEDPGDLRRKLGELAALGIDVMVTETIPGPEDAFCSYYSYLDERGVPLLHFNRHKLRQFPVGFGSACYATDGHDPEASSLGLRFFQGVGLRGIGNVEFKRDARDGRLKLIECNPRFTAGDRHLQLCGLDLPLFVYNRLLGRPVPPVRPRRAGLHVWHPIQDTRAFLALRAAGELTTGAWARSLAHRQHFPVASWRDPLPTLGFHGRLAANELSRRRQRAAPMRVPEREPALGGRERR